MTVYLDASVLVPLFATDALNARAHAFLETSLPALVVSDFAAAEFASAMARRARTGEMTPDRVRAVFSSFDLWAARSAQRIASISADISTAEAYIRRLDLTLRAPDAINVAIARRIGASLATFDARLHNCAQTLGIPVAKVD